MEFLSSRWLLGQARERDRERKANDRLEFLGQGIYDKLLFLDESGPAGKAGLCGLLDSTFRRTSFFDDGFLYSGMSNTAGNFWDERVLELE